MRNSPYVDLAKCTEFWQTLQGRPPRVVHGTALLLLGLLAAALAWSALTRARSSSETLISRRSRTDTARLSSPSHSRGWRSAARDT